MRTSSFALQILLCMSLFSPLQHKPRKLSPPDREQRKGMSYEEYAKLREKMRSQWKKRMPISHRTRTALPRIRPDSPHTTAPMDRATAPATWKTGMTPPVIANPNARSGRKDSTGAA